VGKESDTHSLTADLTLGTGPLARTERGRNGRFVPARLQASSGFYIQCCAREFCCKILYNTNSRPSTLGRRRRFLLKVHLLTPPQYN